MIKIIKYQNNQKNDFIKGDFTYSISHNDHSITVSFTGVFSGKNICENISFEYEKYKGSVQEVFIQDFWKKNEVFIKPVYCQLHNRSIQTSTNLKCQLFRVAFNETCSEVVLFIISKSNDIDGYENVDVDIQEKTTTEYLEEYSSYVRKLIAQNKAKTEMLSLTDPYSSISYLEAQVDALTRIICQEHPENILVKNILCVADKYSVVDIKPLKKIVGEFEKDKQKIRNLQGKYYVEQNNLN